MNPYLMLTALAEAGMRGLDQSTRLPQPVQGSTTAKVRSTLNTSSGEAAASLCTHALAGLCRAGQAWASAACRCSHLPHSV